MSNDERVTKITNLIERHRYNITVSSCEIAEMIVEDEEYRAAQSVTDEARTDGFHSNL